MYTYSPLSLDVLFLTLYLGLMFYQGWLKEDWQKTGLSMLIVISNVIFMFCAAKMIFKEFIEDKIGMKNGLRHQKMMATACKEQGEAVVIVHLRHLRTAVVRSNKLEKSAVIVLILLRKGLGQTATVAWKEAKRLIITIYDSCLQTIVPLHSQMRGGPNLRDNGIDKTA